MKARVAEGYSYTHIFHAPIIVRSSRHYPPYLMMFYTWTLNVVELNGTDPIWN